MRQQTDLQTDLEAGLKLTVDGRLNNFGFTRQTYSVSYFRAIADAKQAVIYAADFYPRYQKDAEIALNPVIHIEMPSVTKATLDLVRGDVSLLAGAPEIVLSQPANFCAPKSERVRWFAAGRDAIKSRVDDVGTFIEKWAIPTLSTMGTPADLIFAYERSDDRFLFQRHSYLFVVGAAVSLGDPLKAKSILVKELGAPGLRKRYRVAFESLGLEGP